MNILATQFTMETRAFEIYVAGCSGNPHCTGCHNAKSWDFNQGRKLDKSYLEEIKKKVVLFDSLIDNLMIFGGEPLDQPLDDLVCLLKELMLLSKTIWLFTRYSIEEIPKGIKHCCDYIKCGRYIPELVCSDNIQYSIKLATSNQKIYKKGKDY